MRIGLSGRIGVGIMLFAAVADGASWLVRAIDDYPFDFYRQIDAYLPVVFLFGLALLLPSISIAIQTKRAASLSKVSLTTVGPLPPELRRDAGQVESGEGAARRIPVDGGEIPQPKLAFVPSTSHPSLLKWFAYASILAAPILDFGRLELLAVTLFASGVALLFWPEVRETEELSLQGETRATYRGMARVSRTLQPLIALTKPLSSLRMASYLVIMVLVIVWGVGAISTPLISTGLLVVVGMPLPNILAANKSRNEPLVLRIDAQGNLSLNRQAVLRADVEKRLRERLSRIADHWVYVDADPSLDAGDVIEAVDMIYGAGDVMVVLVTPSMKKGNSMWAGIPPCEAQALQEPVLRMPRGWPTRWGYQNPLVSFVLNPRGEVSSVKIRKGSGDPEIDEWVLRSVQKWKYTPTPGCGQQAVEITVPVYSW